MKATSIEIKNIQGIEYFKAELGDVTLVSGHNGSGKTSFETAIRSVFKGEKYKTPLGLLRNGTTSGFVKIETDVGITFHLSVDAQDCRLTITKGEMGKIPSGVKSYLDELINPLSLNPISFVNAKKEDRKDFLLQSMPLKLDAEEVKPYLLPGQKVPEGHALEVIEVIYDRVFDERTMVNRSIKEKEASVKELRSTLPETDVEEDKARLRAAESELHEIDAELHEANSGTNATYKTNETLAKAEYEKRIQEANDWHKAELKRIAEVKEKELAENRAKVSDKMTELTGTIASLKQTIELDKKHQVTREVIARNEGELVKLNAQVETLEDNLDSIKALRQKLTENLPIKGVTIKDKDIYIDGVVFEKVNTQRIYDLQMEVARLNVGGLPLIVVDDLEHYDTNHFEMWKEAALKSGLQFVGGLVADSDFQLEAIYAGKEEVAP